MSFVYGALREVPPPRGSPLVEPFLIDLEERTFRFFWDTANPRNGLDPRPLSRRRRSRASPRSDSGSPPIRSASSAATSRAQQARERVLRRCASSATRRRARSQHGMSGYKGFFYHFLDMKTGERFGDSELSTVDTALLLAGVLFCQSYFDARHAEEVEIRKLADAIYRRVDWTLGAAARARASASAGRPRTASSTYDWRGYNEAMLVYLLALGSPTHPVGPRRGASGPAPTTRLGQASTGRSTSSFAPLFGHQYTHVWIDFRGIQDAYMRRRGIDYFENSRRAIYAQRAYAIANPRRWNDYGDNIWGITACDGPGDLEARRRPAAARVPRTPRAASASPTRTTTARIAPTAAVGSMPFAPEIAIPAVLEMHTRYGELHLLGKYGFLDAFNPSFDYDVPLRTAAASRLRLGRQRLPRHRPGPDLAMIENYRSGLVWSVMRSNPYIRRGLERAGFTGGWLAARSAAAHRSRETSPRQRSPAGLARRDSGRVAGLALALRCVGGLSSAQPAPTSRRPLLGDGPRRRGRARSCVPDFERAHPGIRVDVQQLPWTAAHEKLLTAFAGDAMPDLCQLGNTWMPEFAALGALEPLRCARRRIAAIDPRDYFSGIWDTNVVGGTLYGVPWYVDTRLLFYRRDLLAKRRASPRRRVDWDAWAKRARGDQGARGPGPLRRSCCRSTNSSRCSRFALQQAGPLLRDGGRSAISRSAGFRARARLLRRHVPQRLRAGDDRHRRSSNVWDEFGRGISRSTFPGRGTSASSSAACRPNCRTLGDRAAARTTGPASIAGGSSLVVFSESPVTSAAWQLVEYLSRRRHPVALSAK